MLDTLCMYIFSQCVRAWSCSRSLLPQNSLNDRNSPYVHSELLHDSFFPFGFLIVIVDENTLCRRNLGRSHGRTRDRSLGHMLPSAFLLLLHPFRDPFAAKLA